ncbi:MAG: methionine--tRNA ligase [Clostridiales bacterium]|nr:methionine--tRNA ligase [Clostridiales bacterium]
MKEKYYITTPIYYPSGNWHLGHCYTTVICDAIARFKRMDGFDVFFLTGTDEHGVKIEKRAAEHNTTPKAFVDGLVDNIKDLWKVLGISYDKFIRTTDDYHVEAVQKMFKRLYDQGDIYKAEYEGMYCTPCESFWTESQLVDGKCPDCGRPVEKAKEESYFFRLSKYQDKLIELYNKNPEFISPKSRMNEMINNFIKPGLQDLCVSRTSFKWGIPVSFDDKHVIYVWVDALTNYITALGYEGKDDSLFKKYWPANLHMVGKEIVRFHTIIWPAILMALGIEMPEKVYGHGWLLIGGDKMSKSKGNVVDPFILSERYGVDAVRYFLLREVPFGSDGVYTNEALITRTNADLANDLGNLVSRTTAMITQYFGGVVPAHDVKEDVDDELINLCKDALAKVRTHIDNLLVPEALVEIFRLVQRANKYIDETMPWVLAKDESKKARLGTVLYNLAETIRISAVLLSPFVPTTAQKIFDSLQLGALPTDFESVKEFGGLTVGGTVVKGNALFPRLDMKKELAELEKLAEAQAKAKEQPKQEVAEEEPKAEISIDDFAKVELATAKVLTCEKVAKSDKLLKLTLDVAGKERTVVSGIAQYYTPEYMVGKTVVIVKNLKPVKLRGILSEGMILCASNGKDVVFVTPEKEIESGSGVN